MNYKGFLSFLSFFFLLDNLMVFKNKKKKKKEFLKLDITPWTKGGKFFLKTFPRNGKFF